jgi:hypothetical protein
MARCFNKKSSNGNTILNTILFANNQAIFSESEDDQRAVNSLENRANGFNMQIATMKTNTIAFQVENHIRCKISTGNKTIEKY